MSEQKCPVCERLCEIISFAYQDAKTMQCIACGKYHITGSAEMMLSNMRLDDRMKVAFANWIYQNTPEHNKEPLIDGDKLNYLLKNLKLPGLSAKDIHHSKRLKKGQGILDHMGSTELEEDKKACFRMCF